MSGLFVSLGFLLALVIFLITISYVKTSPDVALVISGWPLKGPKFLVGKGGLRIPGLQRADKLYLGQLSVDVVTGRPVPTSDFINVNIDAIAKVRINPENLAIAAANFLNYEPREIAESIAGSLQGNLRELAGTQDLRSLNVDRDGFSNQLQAKAVPDMNKLGIEILSCNIQSITDEKGLIEALGADNTCKITKDASINKANAERDVQIAQAKAQQEANDARVASATAIAEKNNELAVKQAELKSISDIQKAKADAAYDIQQQEQQKEINIRTVDAETAREIRQQEQQREINKLTVEAQVEQARKEQELKEQQISIQQKELDAKINKQADAAKYKLEQEAKAELEQRKRKAEAEAYEAEQKAKAIKAQAEAELFAQQQKAAGIKAVGEAEAAAIKAKGEAEAVAMDKKAEAYKKYNGAAIAEMMVKVLPEMAANVAEPLKSVGEVNIYGTNGSEVAGVTGNVPVLIKQVFDTVKSATGVDLSGVLESSSVKALSVGAAGK